MTENKSPALAWYPRDFVADEHVQLMSLEEEGAYRRLLDHQWLHGSIPADLPALGRICKHIGPARMRRLWAAISPCFIPDEQDTSRLYNRKLERVREEREAYRRQQIESGRLGGLATKTRRRRREPEGSDPTSGASGEPTTDPTGGGVASPVAEGQPAVAFASASAVQSSSVDAREADPPVETGTRAADLVNRLTGAPDRWAVWTFLVRVPDPERPAWVGRLSGYLDGLDFPAGQCPTGAQLATACRDFPAATDPTPAYFRAFVLRLMKPERPSDGPAGPRRDRNYHITGQGAIDAGRAWAEKRTAEDQAREAREANHA